MSLLWYECPLLLPLPSPPLPSPQLFVQAVGEANHLTLSPLVLPKAVMDELLGYGTVKKVPPTDPEVPPRLVFPSSNDNTPSPDLPTLKGELALSKPVAVAVAVCTAQPVLSSHAALELATVC